MGRSVSFSEKRKISPQQDSVENREALLEGLDNCGIEIGPTKLALDEWKSEELTLPDLKTMRTYRLNRIVSELIRYENNKSVKENARTLYKVLDKNSN